MKRPLWRRQQDRELDEEIASHLRLAIADRVARGETLEEATRAARREFGNVALVKEVTRDMWGWIALEQLAQDVRYACRSLRKAPGFAAVAIATFALGIGVNAAMFSVINAVMLRPLPFPQSDRLVAVEMIDLRRGHTSPRSSVSWPDFFDWRSRTRAFERLSAYHELAFTMTVGGRSTYTPGAVVSADFFSTLGVQPLLGRSFRPEEERAGADVAVISDSLWRSEFGAAADAVGRVTTINARPFTIVGVMPAGFRYPLSVPAAQLWVTTAQDARIDEPGDTPITTQRGAHFIRVIGRLRAEATVAAAQAEMDAIAAALAREYPEDNDQHGVALTPELERLVGSTRQPLLVLLVAVGCVLLIACVNLANLALVRGAGRGREIALRLALGASRRRIVVQLLTESVVLSVLGTAVGLLLAAWSIGVLVRMSPADLHRLDEVRIDGAVLAFTAAVGFLSALGSGTIPALFGSGTEPKVNLDDSGRITAGRAHSRARTTLIVAEISVGVVLLVAAGLLLRSFDRLVHTDPGFDASHVVTFKFSLPTSRYPYLKQIAFYDELIADLDALPGVEATAAAPLPLVGVRYGIGFELAGAPLPPSQRASADFCMVGPGFFRALQIPIVEGREFSAADDDAAPRVVVVNESFARQFLNGRNPIGQRIRPGLSTTEKTAPWREVVGVTRDVRQRSLNEPSRPAYFIPYAQGLISTLFIVIRTTAAPGVVVDAARRAVLSKDPEVALYDIRGLDEYVTMSVASARFQMLLLTLFAVLALVLTAVGLYGVVAYGVAQRTREFGIRLALGARPREVMQLVLRHAMHMTGAGVVVGVIGAVFTTRLLGRALYEIDPLDPLTFGAVVGVLVCVALIASIVPARRATRVDPIRSLRTE
jgi:putative ABC transport system permease protein